jgi:pyruvate kinase
MNISTSKQNRDTICNYSKLDLSLPQTLLSTLQLLRQSVYREGQQIFQQWQSLIERKTFWDSCLNLSYYLALRQHDLRPLPTIAADNYQFVKDLLQRGTDCVRINCAHDTINVWEAAIAHVRRAERETGRSCKVLMDLGGPKPRLGEVKFAEGKQKLFTGNSLLLSRDSPKIDHSTDCQASCTIPEILDRLQVGASVWIDDGHIGAIVESIASEGVRLKITHARPKGEKIRPDKGLNFPNSRLRLSSLTNKDRQDLDFVATHADQIGYSFVQEVADIVLLQQELKTRLGDRSLLPAIALSRFLPV